MDAASPTTASPWRYFSSDEVPPRERLAVLNEAFGSTAFPCEVTPSGCGDLYLAGYGMALPDLFITHGVNRGVAYQHSARRATQDSFMLAVTLNGHYHVNQRHAEHLIEPGEGWASLADETASASTLPDETRESLSLILPRRALDAMRVDLDTVLRRPIRCDNEALRLLVAYVRGLEDARSPLSPALAERAAEHVCDLTALALGAGGDTADLAHERGVPAARLHRLKNDISRRLAAGRPVDLATTAARHGISSNYVQKLFGHDGTTFGDFVLAQRLELVRRQLCNPRFAGRNISRIVFDAGFGSLSYFNRAFRRRYGMTPTNMRATAANAATQL